MSLDTAFQGSLFANDFPCEAVGETPDWSVIDAAAVVNRETEPQAIFEPLPLAGAVRRSIVGP